MAKIELDTHKLKPKLLIGKAILQKYLFNTCQACLIISTETALSFLTDNNGKKLVKAQLVMVQVVILAQV